MADSSNNIFVHRSDTDEDIDSNIRLLIKYSSRQVVSELATKYGKDGKLALDIPSLNLVSLVVPN